jgi:hypothetical protein
MDNLTLGLVVWTPAAEKLVKATGADLSDLLARHASPGPDGGECDHRVEDSGISRISTFVLDPRRGEREGSVYVMTTIEGTTICIPREY